MKTQARIVLAVLLMTFVVFVGQSSAQEMGRYIVTIEGRPGPAEQAVIRAGGIPDHVYKIISAIAIRIPDAALPGFARNPFVLLVERDIKVYAIDAELDDSWGVKRIGAGTVHDADNKGTGVKVAIIDTGIDYNHDDLDANFDFANLGYDFVNEDADPMDDSGHGTHVAGTVAAEDNGFGVVGVAPEAALYALKALDAGGSGYYSDVIAALDWAVTNGIQVTNNSYGSSGDPGDAVKTAFDNAAAAGILNVCAAGNSGTPPGKGDNVIYPAKYESCIAVAATDQSDSRARWSSTGPALDISAPGVSINSTLLGGGYGTKQGTSMACPHVAGTLALNLQFGIFDTADDLGDPGWDPKYGWGLVNAAAAAGVSEATGSIAGTVTDGSTAISGATVSVDTGQSATTAADGTYNITGVPTGDRSVTASADGFESQTQTANVTEGQTTTVDFALNPVAEPTTGSIEGTVTNVSDGTAIVGATVSVDTGQSATTAADGTYTITDVPTGDRSVTASADGFESETKTATVYDNLPTTVDFALNPVTTVGNVFVILPSGTDGYATEGGRDGKKHLLITVALVDDLDKPVAGASVSIDLFLNEEPDGSPYTKGTGTTGTNGTVTFKVANAPSGTYTTIVTEVIAEGLWWDGETPPNEFPK